MSWALLNSERTVVLRFFERPESFTATVTLTREIIIDDQPSTVEYEEERTFTPDFFHLEDGQKVQLGLYDVTEVYPEGFNADTQLLDTYDYSVDNTLHVVTRTWSSVNKTSEDILAALSNLAEAKCDEVDAHRDQLLSQGFSFAGRTFQIRETDAINFIAQSFVAFMCFPDSKAIIESVSPELASSIVWDETEKWTDINNEDLQISSPALMLAFALTAATSKKRGIRNSIAHKKAIRTLALNRNTTPSAIQNYDYSAGW
jgi:hypothetical protein